MNGLQTDLVGAVVRFVHVVEGPRRSGSIPDTDVLARIRAVWVNADENLHWLTYCLELPDGRLVDCHDPAMFRIHPARNEPGPPPPDPGDDWRLLR